MQASDLNIQVLDSIFTNNLSQQVVAQYNEWHQGLDPSFKYVKHLLEDYLSANQFKMLKISAQTLVPFFERVANYKFPRTFLRGYLSIIQENMGIIEGLVKFEEMAHNWKSVSIDVLEEYLKAFNIALEGSKFDEKPTFLIATSEIEQKLGETIEGKDYDSAIKLIQMINYPQNSLEDLFAHMVNNKEASKAANYIKTHRLDSKQFPLINKKLNKNMIKYFLNSVGWDAAQEIFQGQSQALWNLIQDLLQKKKMDEAKSVWWRNRLLLQDEAKGLNKDILAIIAQWNSEQLQKTKETLIQNPYFGDYFGPSNKQRHLSLQDFNISENQIYFLSNNLDIIQRFVNHLQNAAQCAIDTQSIVGKTKLDKQKDEPPAIIQIAFAEEAFIIDCSNYHPIVKEAMLKYLSSNKLLLGHALQNDLQGLLLGLGLSKEQRRVFKFGNVVDTCKLFKAIYPNERHSNLAHICLKVLGKQVCKRQTLTNWARRPLRRNQLHYAALDAVAVIHIYHKLQEQVGVNMLTYFLEEM